MIRLQDPDIIENSPKTLPIPHARSHIFQWKFYDYGVTWRLIASFPVKRLSNREKPTTSGSACAHPTLPREPLRSHVTFDDVTSGEKTPLGQILRYFRCACANPTLPREPRRGHVTFDDVTFGEKAPLGRILDNFWLRMRAPHPSKGAPSGSRDAWWRHIQ
jgi:hypothetical protein